LDLAADYCVSASNQANPCWVDLDGDRSIQESDRHDDAAGRNVDQYTPETGEGAVVHLDLATSKKLCYRIIHIGIQSCHRTYAWMNHPSG
jgi:hypothetical protein